MREWLAEPEEPLATGARFFRERWNARQERAAATHRGLVAFDQVPEPLATNLSGQTVVRPLESRANVHHGPAQLVLQRANRCPRTCAPH